RVQRFTIEVPDSALEDLRDRLARTRWPDEIAGAGWEYGSNLAYIKDLMEYWRTGFDWRAHEQALNRLPHFRMKVGGIGIHFIHQRGRGPRPLPLIITHGWPSSFFEMVKIIPMLADPASHGGDAMDSFDVVVPSMPGYGFSDRPSRPGMNSMRIGRLWAELMIEGLGYSRFGAQGGDIGAGIATCLALEYPEHMIGIHLTSLPEGYLRHEPSDVTRGERDFLDQYKRWSQEEGAYSSIQSTRPQTLAYGLNDSPAGMAAWIVEKFRSWSDCGGELDRRFSRDELLVNLTIYWVTETINSSMRHYFESRRDPMPFVLEQRVRTASGFALFPRDINLPPREWAERIYNIQRWTRMASGGHFAAWEEPELLVEEIRAFFRPLRQQI
ncbi:MAG TPA: epoxide hydrolase, partial [Blastocatellia bacterium]|nr:epoxide hydrolase [Blastocatellia bacterium]